MHPLVIQVRGNRRWTVATQANKKPTHGHAGRGSECKAWRPLAARCASQRAVANRSGAGSQPLHGRNHVILLAGQQAVGHGVENILFFLVVLH